jgi:hypothetical protein
MHKALKEPIGIQSKRIKEKEGGHDLDRSNQIEWY